MRGERSVTAVTMLCTISKLNRAGQFGTLCRFRRIDKAPLSLDNRRFSSLLRKAYL
jgi:hypothetical protein